MMFCVFQPMMILSSMCIIVIQALWSLSSWNWTDIDRVMARTAIAYIENIVGRLYVISHDPSIQSTPDQDGSTC